MAFGFFFPDPVFTPGGQNALDDPSNPINNGRTFTTAELQNATYTDVVYLDRNSDGIIGDSDTDDNSVIQPTGVSDDQISIGGVLHDIAELDRDGDFISTITYNGTVLGAADGVIFEVFYFSDGTHFVGFSDDAISIMAAASGGTFDPYLITEMHLDRSDTGDEGGMAASQFSDVTCYAPGTMIDTPAGPRPVETLRVGDLVSTLDHGPQPIRWVHSDNHPLEAARPDAKPVLIAAGALGPGRPEQDLIVSPQHRMIVGGGGQLQGSFKVEAFAPAKSLTGIPGIRHMKGKQQITWIHFACDNHEVVIANGCLSESLLLGPIVMNGLTATEHQSVTVIFGPALTPGAALNGPPARDCLTVDAGRRQLAKGAVWQEKPAAKEIMKWDVDLAMERYEAALMGEAIMRDAGDKEYRLY
jgi:hypothetical protein